MTVAVSDASELGTCSVAVMILLFSTDALLRLTPPGELAVTIEPLQNPDPLIVTSTACPGLTVEGLTAEICGVPQFTVKLALAAPQTVVSVKLSTPGDPILLINAFN